jgi:hypothetical protein
MCKNLKNNLYRIFAKPRSVQAQYSSSTSSYSLRMERIENVSPNSSCIIASRTYDRDCVENIASQLLHCSVLRICCLITGVFAEPFPGNGCLCWVHRSYLEQICHSFITTKFQEQVYIIRFVSIAARHLFTQCTYLTVSLLFKAWKMGAGARQTSRKHQETKICLSRIPISVHRWYCNIKLAFNVSIIH